MINISDDERRRAFSVWLRSGRLPSVRSTDGIEFKFNPWHDPGSGRFTFVGAGRHYGQWGGGGSSGGATRSWARPSQPKSQSTTTRVSQEGSTQTASPSKRSAPSQPSTRGPWAGGGFTGGDGGSFGGTGASGTWGVPEPNVDQSLQVGLLQPSDLWIVRERRTRFPRDLQSRRASNSAQSFSTAIPTRSMREGGLGAFSVC
jgi:hypothetical protein